MQKLLRWILSSYAVVLGACAPAAMGTPGPAPLARAVEFDRAGTEPRDTLSVTIRGPLAVPAATTVQYSASVGNSSARRHYYWWFVASCAKGSGCAPSSYTPLNEGEGLTSVSVPFAKESIEKDIVVQVAEIDGDGRTGSSLEYAVEGPGRRLGGGLAGIGGGVCDWYAGSFYPHTGTFTNPFTGRSWQRGFRRDYCGNRISWEPNGAPR